MPPDMPGHADFDRCFVLEIADLRVAVRTSDPAMRLAPGEALRSFLAEAGPADLELEALWDEHAAPPKTPLQFDSGGIWRLHGAGDRLDFVFLSPVLGDRPYKAASLDSAFGRGTIRLNSRALDPARPVDPLEYPLDELLVVHLLSLGRGVEMHAAGIADESGAGYLFAGQSGAGKSTISGLWLSAGKGRVLSDDRVILRAVNGKIRMYGTPWHGEGRQSANLAADVRAIFFLKHGPQNALERRGGADAAARLLARAFPPFHSASGMQFTLAFLDGIAASVGCFDLSFVPDTRVVDWLVNHPETGIVR